MSGWPRWNQEGEPAALAKYVRPDEVAALVRLPGPAGGSLLDQARAVYEALAAAGITYAYEAPSDDPARQVVREPAEVLWSPRHATCLDLALTLAGACLHAGLRPFVLIVDPPGAVGAAHALLGVRIGDPDPDEPGPPDADLWEARPADWEELVQEEVDGPARPLLLLDPVGVAHALPTSPIIGTGAAFADAARAGARYAAGWTWRVAVDVGRLWRARDSHVPSDHPADDPLRPPYLPLDPELHRPLQLLRPEHEVVPFQARAELTVLTTWCRSVAEGRHTGVAVVHGVGGAGKTRLALELAERLAERHGWYAGYLRKDTPGLAWLGTVTSPTLIVLDYADARPQEARDLLRVLRRRVERGGTPAVVVMTARSTDGQWLDDLRNAWTTDGQLCRERPPMQLPPEHPDGEALVRRAADAFRLDDRQADLEAAAGTTPRDWTTLDRLLLAFLAARSPDSDRLPATRAELYEEVLRHEHRYWTEVYRRTTGTPGDAPLDVLDRAVTALTVRTPVGRKDITAALRTVEELADDARWRDQIRATLTACLQPAPGEPLILRPDPIADHLALRTLKAEEGMLAAVLDGLDQQQVTEALRQFNRAAAADEEAAAEMVAEWIGDGEERWLPVLVVAFAQRGAALEALEQLVDAPRAPSWLNELADRIPDSALGLPGLALRAELRCLAELSSAGGGREAERAVRLLRVARQQSDTGDLSGAVSSAAEGVALLRRLADTDPSLLVYLTKGLGTLAVHLSDAGDHAAGLGLIVEATAHYRRLAATDPDTFLPDLSAALNNLSGHQAELGQHAAALATATEAIDIRRRLAAANPDVFLPDLATSLNNLASHQASLGDHAAALATATEAINIRRRLSATNPVLLPGLATTLSNLAVHQSDVGDHAAALATATEAINIRRQLAAANPDVFLPDLATSLNNLSTYLAHTGDRAAALATGTEAVSHLRRLSAANPRLFLADLASSLNNLSNYQAALGDRHAALESGTEAVSIHRRLTDAPLQDLASSLNNLSNQQAEVGDRTGALASITEAVDIRRRLATANPVAFLPDLATTLNNLSNRQAGVGDRTGALASITEAVDIRRRLATANPAAFLPDLASSLNNLSNHQSNVGDHAAALESITEAIDHYRQLAATNPAVFLPDLAMALGNLANQQAGVGDHTTALASVTEAVDIRRRLATANPRAFLPDLASSLNNLSAHQAEVGQPSAALASITEAIDHYRQLAATNPGAFLPDLASSLNNLSVHRANNGDHTAALASVTEAVNHYRQLAATNPGAFLPNLASSLNNLSNRQANNGDHTAALASITEAVNHYRQLAATNPGAFLPDLASSLNNLSVHRANNG
ncbi:tetratricopeptide repeat protein, partial [Kitasatospora sp. NPDC057692]|uniref:tetratricopeptide repeat protein n=1 Tax=Kitasatospora sp. NPDC057692 TaxID=3346215 RepID=UPI00368CC4E6